MKKAKESRDAVGTAAPVTRSALSLGFSNADLKIKDIMTDRVVCAVPTENVLSAVKRMSEHRVSCVVVVDGDTVAGILTERDVLRGVAERGRDLLRSSVAERMSSPLISISPESPVLEASVIMRSQRIKRLGVLQGQRLVGLVTQTDITRGLISLAPFKDVGDIMSTDVVTVDASVTVARAARLMSSRNISCVVVVHRQEAVGIVTEKDVLKRVIALHRDPGTTLVAEVMSHPLETSPPKHSVICVNRMMDRMRIHRLVVAENKQVCGIVSQTDILDAVRGELEDVREAQWRRESEVSELTDSTAKNLSSMENLVREALGIPERPGEPSALTGTCEHALCGSPASVRPGPYPATAVDPILTSLQDLISESKSNLDRISGLVRNCSRGKNGVES